MTAPETLASYLRERMAAGGIESIRGLAARTGISAMTARRLLTFEEPGPSEQTLARVAENLPASLQRLRELARRPIGERVEFRLPPEANQLDERQRSVVLSVVQALLDASTAGASRVSNTGNGDAPHPRPRLVGRPRDTDGSAL